MKKIAVLLSLSLLFVIFGCAGGGNSNGSDSGDKSTLDKVKERGTLIVGVKTESPPFGFLDDKGEHQGFEIDLVRELAKELGVDIEFKSVNVKTRTIMVANGSIDMACATTTHKKSREETVDFTITYFMDGQKLLVKKGSGIKSADDLAGKTVAAIQGATSEANLKKAQPDCIVKSFPEYPQAMMALSADKVDALTTDSGILAGQRAKSKDPDEYEIVGGFISAEPYGIIIREGDSDWRDWLNIALMEIWESGKYEEIYDKWLGPDTIYNLPLAFEMELWP